MNKNNQSFFTLIELMVVVAILGILISMLLPSLSKARGEALKALCINNLRQIGIATYLYNDYNETFPSTQGKAHKLIQLTVIEDDSYAIWECPADGGTWGNQGGANCRPLEDGQTCFDYGKTSYRWNYFATMPGNGNNPPQDISLNRLQNTSKYVLLSNPAIMGTWGSRPVLEDCWHKPGKPYFPIGFADGHAKFMTDSRILSSETWRINLDSMYITNDPDSP